MVKLFDFKSRTTSMFIVVLPVPELFVPVTVYVLRLNADGLPLITAVEVSKIQPW
jgi:hypothetical protein